MTNSKVIISTAAFLACLTLAGCNVLPDRTASADTTPAAKTEPVDEDPVRHSLKAMADGWRKVAREGDAEPDNKTTAPRKAEPRKE